MTSKCKAITKKNRFKKFRPDVTWIPRNIGSSSKARLKPHYKWMGESLNNKHSLVGHTYIHTYIKQWKGDDGEPEGYGMKMKTQGKLNDATKKEVIVCATFCSVLIYNQQKKIGTKSRKPEMNRNECTTVSKKRCMRMRSIIIIHA